MKKITILSIFSVLLTVFIIVYNNDMKTETNLKQVDVLQVMLSENQINTDEMKDIAHLIVSGKFIKKEKEAVFENSEIKSTISYFSFQVYDTYKSNNSEEANILVGFGGSVLPQGVEYNTEYIIYLVNTSDTNDTKPTYGFVSVSQGILRREKSHAINFIGQEIPFDSIQ